MTARAGAQNQRGAIMKKLRSLIKTLALLVAILCCGTMLAAAYEVGHEKHAYIGSVVFDHSKIKQAPVSAEELIRQAAPGPDGYFNVSHKNNGTMKIYDAFELVRYPLPFSPDREGKNTYWGMGMTEDWAPTKRLNIQKWVY